MTRALACETGFQNRDCAMLERQVDERGIFLFWASNRHEASTHNIFPQELVEHIALLAVVSECWIPVTPYELIELMECTYWS